MNALALNMDTLVLNAVGDPINTVSARKAFVYWLQNRAQIIHEYEDKYLGTWSGAFNAPAVVKLLTFIKPKKKLIYHETFNRKNIWLRDNGECQFVGCGKKLSRKEMTFDHVIPKDQGGRLGFKNIVCACTECNGLKANRTPEEAGMKLRRKPFAPKLPFAKEKEIILGIKNLRHFPHESWKSYVYWTIALEEDE